MGPPATPPLGAMVRLLNPLTAPASVTCAPVTSSVPTLTVLPKVVVPAPVRIVRPGSAPASLLTVEPNVIAPPAVYLPEVNAAAESPTSQVFTATVAAPL